MSSSELFVIRKLFYAFLFKLSIFRKTTLSKLSYISHFLNDIVTIMSIKIAVLERMFNVSLR